MYLIILQGMKRSYFTTLFLAIAISSIAQHKADIQTDSLKSEHRITFIGDGETPHQDSVRAIIDKFYFDQFRHFQDPRAPYFLFMSKDSKFAMGIGGVVRMRGWYDWGGVIPYNGFIPYAISVPRNDIARKKISTTPAGTALYFRVIGNNHRLGDYQLYIETNFDGYNQVGMKLKKAYATVNDWTIGYANSTFGDPAAFPPLIDAQGPQAEVQTTAVLLRWIHSIDKNWTIAASVETPQSQVGYDNITTSKVEEWAPNLAAFGQFGWGTNQHIRLSGIMRVLPYHNMVSGSNERDIGWGLQLSSIFRPSNSITLYATGNIGRGYGSLTGDLIMGNYDLINNPNVHGEMYAPESFAWYGAIQYHFRPNLFATATVGQERFLPKYNVSGDTYKYGLYSAFNVFWDITPRFEVAAEVNFGKRANFNGESNWARRACLMAQFSF